jgi:hypothetical protein
MPSTVSRSGLATCLACIGWVTISAAQTAAPATPSVTIGGVVYTQYLYQVKDTANHVNNFDVTRAYLTATGKFAGGLGTRLTADVYRNADGSLGYRLKYAYAAYTPSHSALTFKLGEIHTPWLDWEEALWDYRMQGQMAMERAGYLTSSDLGAGIDGNWGSDRVNAQFGFYNGEGYSHAPGDQRKDAMGRVSFRLLDTDDASRVGGLRLTGYGQIGKPTGGGIRDRFIGMLSYRSKGLTLAGEFDRTKDRQDAPPAPATPSTSTIDGQVLSFFGVYKFPRIRTAIIGRVDITDPDTDTPNNRLTRYIAGASYQLTSVVRLLADVDDVVYQGGSPTPAQYATKAQALFQAQLVF